MLTSTGSAARLLHSALTPPLHDGCRPPLLSVAPSPGRSWTKSGTMIPLAIATNCIRSRSALHHTHHQPPSAAPPPAFAPLARRLPTAAAFCGPLFFACIRPLHGVLLSSASVRFSMPYRLRLARKPWVPGGAWLVLLLLLLALSFGVFYGLGRATRCHPPALPGDLSEP